MKKLPIAVFSLLVASTVFAATPHLGPNAIGDLGLVTLGEYAFSNPVIIDLAPTNAPQTNGVYAIRCQIIYVDEDVQVPKDEQAFEDLRQTGDWLTEQLKAFIAENYAGAEFEDLCSRYFEGAIGIDLAIRFPFFVWDRMGEADRRIDIVKVQVFADGDLRRALIDIHNEQNVLPRERTRQVE